MAIARGQRPHAARLRAVVPRPVLNPSATSVLIEPPFVAPANLTGAARSRASNRTTHSTCSDHEPAPAARRISSSAPGSRSRCTLFVLACDVWRFRLGVFRLSASTRWRATSSTIWSAIRSTVRSERRASWYARRCSRLFSLYAPFCYLEKRSCSSDCKATYSSVRKMISGGIRSRPRVMLWPEMNRKNSRNLQGAKAKSREGVDSLYFI